MAGEAYIGTSGWSYGRWKDDFYKGVPQKRWLEFCAANFTGLEANGTFYRLQAEKTFKQWLERTPDDSSSPRRDTGTSPTTRNY